MCIRDSFSVVQVGINAVAILGGVVGEAVFTDVFAAVFAYVVPPEALTPVSFFCSFLLVTILFVMFADLIPKRVAMSCPEKVAVRCISPMVTLIMLLKPLVWLLTVLANAIMRMMRVPLNNQDQITNEDVIATVEAGAKAGVIEMCIRDSWWALHSIEWSKNQRRCERMLEHRKKRTR